MTEASLLKKLPFFHSFSEKECAAVTHNAAERFFKKGEIIFQEGESGDAFYIILSGEVAIEKKPLLKTTQALSTLRLKQGDFFGELSLFDAGPRTSTARAAEDTQTILISQTDLADIYLKNPALTSQLFKNMLQIIASRIRSINQELMTFYEIDRLLSASHTQESLLKNVLEILIAALEAEDGLILIKNPVTEKIEIIGSRQRAPQNISETEILNSPLIGKILSEGKVFLTAPDNNQEKICDIPLLKEKAALIVPFGETEKKTGLIVLIGRRKISPQSPPVFSGNDATLVQAVTSQLGLALENIRFQIESEGRQKLERHYFTL